MQCTRPETLDAHKGGKLVPCGYCPACKYNERVGWTFRLAQEAKQSKEVWFITLTYDQENIPLWDAAYEYHLRGIEQNSSNRYESLNDKDLITFLNSVKKAQARETKLYQMNSLSPSEAFLHRRTKYYAVGEYGGTTGRPHYHIVLFNVWSTIANEKRLEEIWQKGTVECTPITDARIHYVTGYIHEKSHYKRGKQTRPRMYCSKGLGEDYVKKNKQWHKQLLNPWIWFNGYKIAMPKYYKDKIFTEAEKEIIYQKLIDHHQQNPPELPTSRHFDSRQQTEYSIKSRYKKHKL